ncbi:MAG: H/ACA ribonucleoprotein complex subunit GAR1/NAF1 [archaeon]|nr:H/ACA ribonucleoprotein complex subunit GAR1/NAF1 [archaeon]
MGKTFNPNDRRGGNRGGGRGNRGGRGGRPKPDWNAPPESTIVVGTCMHPVEEFILVKNTLKDKVPIFGRPVYINDKKKIGLIEDVLGPINDFMFTVKCDEGIPPTSIKEEEKIYMNPEHFLPFERFLPKKPGQKGQGRGGAKGGRGGARGGRGGRGNNRGSGGFRPPRGNSSGGYRPPRGGSGGFRPPHK